MSGAVDLWSWRLTGGDLGALSPDEVARAERFAHPRDRDRFVAARARLREIVAGYLGGEPAAVRFRYNAHGRPEVDGLRFNLSHDGDLALLAAGGPWAVGVDVEAVRPIGLDLAWSCFAPGEAQALDALPVADRLQAFYRCWTRKEAYLKGRGTGLAADPASFEVSLGPGEPARVLWCDSGEAGLWRLRDLDVGPGMAAALAARTEGRPLALRWRSRA